jgi:hypothetical protein
MSSNSSSSSSIIDDVVMDRNKWITNEMSTNKRRYHTRFAFREEHLQTLIADHHSFIELNRQNWIECYYDTPNCDLLKYNNTFLRSRCYENGERIWELSTTSILNSESDDHHGFNVILQNSKHGKQDIHDMLNTIEKVTKQEHILKKLEPIAVHNVSRRVFRRLNNPRDNNTTTITFDTIAAVPSVMDDSGCYLTISTFTTTNLADHHPQQVFKTPPITLASKYAKLFLSYTRYWQVPKDEYPLCMQQVAQFMISSIPPNWYRNTECRLKDHLNRLIQECLDYDLANDPALAEYLLYAISMRFDPNIWHRLADDVEEAYQEHSSDDAAKNAQIKTLMNHIP